MDRQRPRSGHPGDCTCSCDGAAKKKRALLTAIASTLSGQGKLKLTNDWGLCALTWSFTDVFPDAEFSDFRERLRAEVGRRGLSEEMVSRSQFGPDEW
mmetsp:Transcript_162261/g.515491  ORF Transcript_162261/g.515491 Transcript_162261/m.515491 type:complete len:98 (-) Transcript_162261:95-388(-)